MQQLKNKINIPVVKGVLLKVEDVIKTMEQKGISVPDDARVHIKQQVDLFNSTISADDIKQAEIHVAEKQNKQKLLQFVNCNDIINYPIGGGVTIAYVADQHGNWIEWYRFRERV